MAVFGDAAFEAFCLRTYDRDGDGVLTVGEIKSVWLLEFDNKDIQSLEGIEYFTGLQYLSCNLAAGGNLVRLDVSRNAELRKLYCYGNKLEELVITGLRNLVYVDCTSNRLEKLDLRDLPVLEVLICRENRLRSLDFSANPCLTHIDCMDDRIPALDVSGLQNLEGLNCVHSPALKTVFFKNRAQYDKILSLQLDQQVLVRFKEDS